MQITISDDTYQRLVTHLERLGLPVGDVGVLADQKLREAVSAEPAPIEGQPSGALVEAFARFRGTMKETTVEQLAADRHAGLL
ncbi:hypothetical protein Pla175_51760 [Pirellulimonas nuda]|uniref:Uncharacterized protein n=1 Tax=Pirellulimonas nuda TaxID=2528009 RepID=A0A518DJT7_9BACT|nr:hypothetical protein [Pirellulimonas nuda]QDU91745.1 hypothetical protein Pla175_51760 [Pirellulimonas nuda]